MTTPKSELMKVGNALAYHARKLHQAALDPEDVTPTLNPEDVKTARALHEIANTASKTAQGKSERAEAQQEAEREAKRRDAIAALQPSIDVVDAALPDLRALAEQYLPIFKKLSTLDRATLAKLPGRLMDRTRAVTLVDEALELASGAVTASERALADARHVIASAGQRNDRGLQSEIRSNLTMLNIVSEYPHAIRELAQSIKQILDASSQYQN